MTVPLPAIRSTQKMLQPDRLKAPSISIRHHDGTDPIFLHRSKCLARLYPSCHGLGTERARPSSPECGERHIRRDCGLPVVSCDKISELPHLVFDFGGQEIALNGEDYIGEAEWLFCFRGPYCSPLIGSSLRDDNTIVLGPSFLKKVYSVFNWDERTVLCKSRT